MPRVSSGLAHAFAAAALLSRLAGPVTAVHAETLPIYSEMDRMHPVYAANGMVASQEALATNIGVDILKRGGNAVDAAVAVGFALAVTLPRGRQSRRRRLHAGPHGGNRRDGRHRLSREGAGDGEPRHVPRRERQAPIRSSRAGAGSAIGVPGTVAGLALALKRYGTMSLADVMAPAIALAKDGVEVTPGLAEALAASHATFAKYPSSAAIFLKPDGGDFQPGNQLMQSDLAQSLQAIAKDGSDAFYRGAIGERIAAEMARSGGLITTDDLAQYEAIVREPVKGTYRGYEILSMPPPSSGGTHVIEILNILEGYPIGALGFGSAETMHLMAEAMKRAYADRSEYLGDSDFVDVPVKGLTSKAYAESLRATIDESHATPSAEIKPGEPLPYESDQTTHFSVVDSQGNAVSNTYTLNFGFGSGLVAEGTGILLNNEMDDFSAKPGVPNAYGLIGGDANAVAPKKRPLSSMSPTIVLKDDETFLVTGSPGGSRIITTVLQVIMNVIDHGMNIAEASAAPRMHHQWLPDELRVEEGFSPDTLKLLEAMGHKVAAKATMGSTQSILRRDDGALFGASDPRRPTALTAGY